MVARIRKICVLILENNIENKFLVIILTMSKKHPANENESHSNKRPRIHEAKEREQKIDVLDAVRTNNLQLIEKAIKDNSPAPWTRVVYEAVKYGSYEVCIAVFPKYKGTWNYLLIEYARRRDFNMNIFMAIANNCIKMEKKIGFHVFKAYIFHEHQDAIEYLKHIWTPEKINENSKREELFKEIVMLGIETNNIAIISEYSPYIKEYDLQKYCLIVSVRNGYLDIFKLLLSKLKGYEDEEAEVLGRIAEKQRLDFLNAYLANPDTSEDGHDGLLNNAEFITLFATDEVKLKSVIGIYKTIDPNFFTNTTHLREMIGELDRYPNDDYRDKAIINLKHYIDFSPLIASVNMYPSFVAVITKDDNNNEIDQLVINAVLSTPILSVLEHTLANIIKLNPSKYLKYVNFNDPKIISLLKGQSMPQWLSKNGISYAHISEKPEYKTSLDLVELPEDIQNLVYNYVVDDYDYKLQYDNIVKRLYEDFQNITDPFGVHVKQQFETAHIYTYIDGYGEPYPHILIEFVDAIALFDSTEWFVSSKPYFVHLTHYAKHNTIGKMLHEFMKNHMEFIEEMPKSPPSETVIKWYIRTFNTIDIVQEQNDEPFKSMYKFINDFNIDVSSLSAPLKNKIKNILVKTLQTNPSGELRSKIDRFFKKWFGDIPPPRHNSTATVTSSAETQVLTPDDFADASSE